MPSDGEDLARQAEELAKRARELAELADKTPMGRLIKRLDWLITIFGWWLILWLIRWSCGE